MIPAAVGVVAAVAVAAAAVATAPSGWHLEWTDKRSEAKNLAVVASAAAAGIAVETGPAESFQV